MSLSRKAYFLMLAAVLLAGFGRIAILPPFEGVDETAHYSRILAAAFPPDKPEDAKRIDGGVYGYYPNGPMSNGWVRNPFMHRQDPRLKGRTDATGVYADYHVFFEKDAKAGKYVKLYRTPPVPSAFTPSPEPNWQYQHPPAYYFLLGRVARLLPDMTLAGRLFALRGFGFLLAIAGLAMGLRATRRYLEAEGYKNAAAVTAFGAFYPFVMPSFFNDVTRMGNDTLLLFAFGIVWALLLRHLRAPGGWRSWGPLGLAMGAALLVKATMGPPAAGIVLFLAARGLWRGGARGLVPAACTGALAALIAALWYVPYFTGPAFRGEISGLSVFSHETRALPLATLLSFALESVFGAIVHFSDAYSFKMAAPSKLAAGLPALWALAAYAATALRKKGLLAAEALPLWAVSPLLAALALHSVFTALAFGPDVPATIGYYAHVLAPAFALCLGLGFTVLRDGRAFGTGRDITAVLGLMAAAGTADLFWRQARMYGGCWWEDKALQKVVTAPCDHDPLLLFRHLEILAWPGLGAACFGAGFLCAALGFGLILLDGQKTRPH